MLADHLVDGTLAVSNWEGVAGEPLRPPRTPECPSYSAGYERAVRKGPLSDSYPGAVALVVCSLIPFLALTAAVLPVLPQVGESLHLSPSTLDIAIAMSTAGYAVGTVFAVQLALRLPSRRMLIVYESVFVVASLLAATTNNGDVFVGALIVQGLCTSLLLIAAVPPLVTAWPAKKMPTTGGIMNLCIFGAVAVGPTVGAETGAAMSWHVLFWGVAAVAILALLFAVLTYEDQPPTDTSAPWDIAALTMALVGSGAAFYGAGALEAFGRDATRAFLLCAGFVLIVGLVVYQYKAKTPLMPVRAFATTVPVVGITLALFASASGFGLMELVLTALRTASTPSDTALLFLPEFVGAVAVAGLFAAVFRTKYVTVLAFSGMVCIVASAAVFLVSATSGSAIVGLGTGLLGLGLGASVAPALFMAGFSLRASQLQRVFALIELMRGVTAFLVAPLLLYLVTVLATTTTAAIDDAIWICLGLAATGFLVAYGLYGLGKSGLDTPDIDSWQEEGQQAWSSPALLARLRPPPTDASTSRRSGV